MPTERGPDRWVPKAFRPEPPPSVDDLLSFVRALREHASTSTRQLFERLAGLRPSQRLREATTFVIGCMHANPVLGNVLQQALTIDEYASVQELLLLPLTPRQRMTADHLLCVRERELVASFFRRAFRVLSDSGQDELYIHPFDEV